MKILVSTSTSEIAQPNMEAEMKAELQKLRIGPNSKVISTQILNGDTGKWAEVTFKTPEKFAYLSDIQQLVKSITAKVSPWVKVSKFYISFDKSGLLVIGFKLPKD